jgi:hypothetical protein
MPIAYTVRCEFQHLEVAEAWIAWLATTHLAEVRAAGATRAELVRLDGDTVVCEARYVFESRAAFAAYERDHAPRLRADGLHRFPLARGLSYQRSVGEIVARA